jgi:hypothetical protein
MLVEKWILGVPRAVSFMGCVGDDDNAAILKSRAEADGVWVEYQVNKEQPTGEFDRLGGFAWELRFYRSLCWVAWGHGVWIRKRMTYVEISVSMDGSWLLLSKDPAFNALR